MYLSCLLIDVGENPDRPRPGRLWLRNLYRVHQRLCMAFPSKERQGRDEKFLQPYAPKDFKDEAPARDVLDGRADIHEERSDKNGFLFRIDHGSERGIERGRPPVILVQSSKRPDWDYAFGLTKGQRDPCTGKPVGNAGCLLAALPEVKDIEYASLVKEGGTYHFRLNANPTRRLNHGPFKGKRVSVGRGAKAVLDWLARKGEVNEKNGKKGRGGFELVFKPGEDGWDPEWRIATGLLHAWKKENGHGEAAAKMSFAYAAIDGLLKVTDAEAFLRTLQTGVGPAKAFGFGLLSVAPVKEKEPAGPGRA